MEYVNLGRTGLKVSSICLGTMSFGTSEYEAWVLPEEESRPFIKRALELGINFFDTADQYSHGASEEVLGRALGDFTRREEVVIATKVYFSMGEGPNQRGLSRKHIMESIDSSLQRLGTDYVDLYQIHRWDYQTPIEETLEALNDVVRAGKARYIGASSMFAWQFAKALRIADLHRWTRFACMQDHYTLIYREEEREMLPLCKDEGIGVICWSPLARGILAGARHKDGSGETKRCESDPFAHVIYYKDDNDFDVVERVRELAEQRGLTMAQISLAWLLHKPPVTAAILGATKMHHLEEAVASVEISLSEEELSFIEELYRPHKVMPEDV